MTLNELKECVPLDVVILPGQVATRDVEHVVASDLMSDVLMVDRDGVLLVTSLASDQSLRTAHVIDAVGVVVVNNKQVTQSMCKLAEEFGIALFCSAKTKYEACLAIGAAIGEAGL